MYRVLLIEDDLELASLIQDFLAEKNIECHLASNYEQTIFLIKSKVPHLILCDIMLNRENGLDIVESIRSFYSNPIILMTALEDNDNQIAGFQAGADDYVIKPIDPDVLYARMRAHFKRMGINNQHTDNDLNIRIDDSKRVLHYQQKSIRLSKAEYDLFLELMRSPDHPLSREYLFEATVGRSYDGLDRTIDGRISRLRKKLNNLNFPVDIRTEWGRGYTLFKNDDNDDHDVNEETICEETICEETISEENNKKEINSLNDPSDSSHANTVVN